MSFTVFLLYWFVTGFLTGMIFLGVNVLIKRKMVMRDLNPLLILMFCGFFSPIGLGVGAIIRLAEYLDDCGDTVIFRLPKRQTRDEEIAQLKREIEELTKTTHE